ncbi:hypothetical protein [Mycolicibacterium sediminis]|uniref:Uncharacterized protein n=1 Tax=Mycolicibacterium sediminis TaxID=1286180 RepID=A0A7I7QKD0_9MYCO|nr:hypothetical protein [Mycolicibacterium sediminis]BBY26711.1 hypothetical protein MSEDJ_08070 [Mycolicibacterium sediminis]
MELTWWLVVIVACLALAVGIVVALLLPIDDRRRLRPLANVDRLTRLPAYVRAVRRRTVTTIATLVLLAVAAAAAVVVAARPTGLPTAAHDAAAGQPEDVMVCAGAPLGDRRLEATLRFFAARVPTFDTQRIGLTSPNRRVIPLTRDHQYAAGRFADYAAPVTDADVDDRRGDFAPDVRYVNYAEGVDDLLALCLTGFPGFDEPAPQRRSIVYVGPGRTRDSGPAIVGASRLTELATTAGVQVNVITTTPDDVLSDLARATGGRYVAAESNVAQQLEEIRANPPVPTPEVETRIRAAAPESPDVPLLVALAALTALSLVPLVVRR